MHPLSIRPFGLAALASSGPVTLRHPKLTTYRCFLPDLTGFVALRRVGPGPQRRSAQPVPRYANLEREFSPAIAACGYRAPLAPRLARPVRSYHLPFARQGKATQSVKCAHSPSACSLSVRGIFRCPRRSRRARRRWGHDVGLTPEIHGGGSAGCARLHGSGRYRRQSVRVDPRSSA